MTRRLGINCGKVKVNLARTVKTRTENNKRNRFLSKEEENRLRQQIEATCPERLPEFEIALHAGMRRSEQFGLTWDCVDFESAS
jgi:integrase